MACPAAMADNGSTFWLLSSQERLIKSCQRASLAATEVIVMSEGVLTAESPLVLVVDDDQATRALLRRVMERDGYRVAEASNGIQAVTAVTHLRPQLVLLDAIMPGMEGFEACQQIVESPEGTATAVLIMTSLDDRASVDRAYAAGARAYITKPFHWPALREHVRSLLQRQAAALV
jgi:PleD family two-component response regulator